MARLWQLLVTSHDEQGRPVTDIQTYSIPVQTDLPFIHVHDRTDISGRFEDGNVDRMTLDISQLIATQSRVFPDKVDRMSTSVNTLNQPIKVVCYMNKLYVWDGHHRLLARKICGLTEIEAEVLSLEAT